VHDYDFQLASLTLGQAGEFPGEFPSDPSSGDVIPQCAPGEAIDFKTGRCVSGGLPPGFVAPGAVAIRPGNWDTSHKPFALYTLAPGDTYTGLAKTYLDNGSRWREIWDLNRAQHPNPDRIFAGQRINMPDEAKRIFQKKSGQAGGMLPWLIGGALLAAGAAYMASR
jgi:hypothetical protein